MKRYVPVLLSSRLTLCSNAWYHHVPLQGLLFLARVPHFYEGVVGESMHVRMYVVAHHDKIGTCRVTLERTTVVHHFPIVNFVCDLFQDFPEVAGVIAGMDDPIDSPWRVEVRLTTEDCVEFLLLSSFIPCQIMAGLLVA